MRIIKLSACALFLLPLLAAAGPEPTAIDSLTTLSGPAVPDAKGKVPKAVKMRADKWNAEVTARLRYDETCILRLVAAEMEIPLKKEVSLPAVYFGSKVPFAQFLAAYRTQSNAEPTQVLNMYMLNSNEIYISDKASNYASFGRSMDDSLAHEYVHYLQVKYRGYTVRDFVEDFEDSLENQAIRYQVSFREKYIVVEPPEGVCAER